MAGLEKKSTGRGDGAPAPARILLDPVLSFAKNLPRCDFSPEVQISGLNPLSIGALLRCRYGTTAVGSRVRVQHSSSGCQAQAQPGITTIIYQIHPNPPCRGAGKSAASPSGMAHGSADLPAVGLEELISGALQGKELGDPQTHWEGSKKPGDSPQNPNSLRCPEKEPR